MTRPRLQPCPRRRRRIGHNILHSHIHRNTQVIERPRRRRWSHGGFLHHKVNYSFILTSHESSPDIIATKYSLDATCGIGAYSSFPLPILRICASQGSPLCRSLRCPAVQLEEGILELGYLCSQCPTGRDGTFPFRGGGCQREVLLPCAGQHLICGGTATSMCAHTGN